MIFILDNYDSFTYNLYQYLGELHGQVEVARNDEITLEQIEAINPGAIVISPGPGYPSGAGISIDVIRRFSGKIPIRQMKRSWSIFPETFAVVPVTKDSFGR